MPLKQTWDCLVLPQYPHRRDKAKLHRKSSVTLKSFPFLLLCVACHGQKKVIWSTNWTSCLPACPFEIQHHLQSPCYSNEHEAQTPALFCSICKEILTSTHIICLIRDLKVSQESSVLFSENKVMFLNGSPKPSWDNIPAPHVLKLGVPGRLLENDNFYFLFLVIYFKHRTKDFDWSIHI